MEEALKEAIEQLAKRCKENISSSEAQQLSQAANNLANTLNAVKTATR